GPARASRDPPPAPLACPVPAGTSLATPCPAPFSVRAGAVDVARSAPPAGEDAALAGASGAAVSRDGGGGAGAGLGAPSTGRDSVGAGTGGAGGALARRASCLEGGVALFGCGSGGDDADPPPEPRPSSPAMAPAVRSTNSGSGWRRLMARSRMAPSAAVWSATEPPQASSRRHG